MLPTEAGQRGHNRREVSDALRYLARARDDGHKQTYERLPETVVGLYFIACACLMLHRVALLHAGS